MDQERPAQPLKRTRCDCFVPVTWDQALREFTGRFKEIQWRHGRESIAVLVAGSLAEGERALLWSVAVQGMGALWGTGLHQNTLPGESCGSAWGEMAASEADLVDWCEIRQHITEARIQGLWVVGALAEPIWSEVCSDPFWKSLEFLVVQQPVELRAPSPEADLYLASAGGCSADSPDVAHIEQGSINSSQRLFEETALPDEEIIRLVANYWGLGGPLQGQALKRSPSRRFAGG